MLNQPANEEGKMKAIISKKALIEGRLILLLLAIVLFFVMIGIFVLFKDRTITIWKGFFGGLT